MNYDFELIIVVWCVCVCQCVSVFVWIITYILLLWPERWCRRLSVCKYNSNLWVFKVNYHVVDSYWINGISTHLHHSPGSAAVERWHVSDGFWEIIFFGHSSYWMHCNGGALLVGWHYGLRSKQIMCEIELLLMVKTFVIGRLRGD